MPIELTLANDSPLEFHPGLPTNYSGPVLRGAGAVFTKTNIADLVLQELTGENYSIRFLVGKFLKRVNARGWIHTDGLYSYFMLKNGTRKKFDTIGNLHLRQDQYACFFTESSTDCSAIFEKNNEFRALDFFYSPSLIEELLPFFPELKTVLLGSQGFILPGKACWALPSMKEITNQILNCPYDEDTRQFYFDIKVRELLYQILENAFKRKPITQFTPWETARIHEARKILENYISQKPPSIRFLARKVALNEFKLKTGFRQYFNTSIFDWLMEQKMQHAKNLLLTTNKPIKDICVKVGYPRTTNFITAFRRRFGMTPGSLRRL